MLHSVPVAPEDYPNVYAGYDGKGIDTAFLKQHHLDFKENAYSFFLTLVEFGDLAFCWK